MKAQTLIASAIAAAVCALSNFTVPFEAFAADTATVEKATPDVFLDEGSVDDFAEPTPMGEPALKPPPASAVPATEPATNHSAESATVPAPQKRTKSPKKSVEAAKASPIRQKPKAKSTPAASAEGDSVPAATGGKFRTTVRDCDMLAEPVEGAQKLISVASGKKIWTESAGSGWIKAFRKSGAGFLAGECFK